MGSSWSGRSYMGVGIRYEKQVPELFIVECHLLLGWIGGSHVGCHLMLGCLETLYKGGCSSFCTISPAATWPYHLLYCLCWTVGPWVKVPKALEEDTPMWVYGVGPALGFRWMGKSKDETNKHMHTCLT
ncbi:hypothetical protein AAG906_024458 [Vitis piasezkii]